MGFDGVMGGTALESTYPSKDGIRHNLATVS
jgi:hypothetical protein